MGDVVVGDEVLYALSADDVDAIRDRRTWSAATPDPITGSPVSEGLEFWATVTRAGIGEGPANLTLRLGGNDRWRVRRLQRAPYEWPKPASVPGFWRQPTDEDLHRADTTSVNDDEGDN